MAVIEGFRPILNVRDLGGIRGADGRRVRRGLIYRSGGPYRFDGHELELARTFGLAAVMDLRTTRELEANPDPEFPGARMIHYSGLEFKGGEEIDFSPEGMHRLGEDAQDQYDKFTAYYREMPFDNEAFRNLMAALEAGQVPLLFHCASGKDRTGVAAMAVLLALGADEQAIMDDYLLTNALLADDIEQALEEHAEHIASDSIHEKLILMEAGVLEETGLSVLDELHVRYPSPEAYLEAEFGLTPERLAAFRNRYLEDAS